MKNYILILFIGFFGSLAYAQEPVAPGRRDSNIVKELFFDGMREKLKENYANASASFSKIITLDPKNDAVFYELAVVNYRQNKLAETEDYLNKAILLNRNNIWYYKMLAEVYKRTNNMKSLVTLFDQLIRLDPENEDFFFDKANAWFLAGNTAEALKAYDLVEKKFGQSADLAAARQRIMLEGKTAPANAEVEKLIADNPDDIKNYIYLSGMLLQKNKTADALALLLKAKGKAPENFQVNLALADIYRSSKEISREFDELKIAFNNGDMPVDQKIKILVKSLPGATAPETRSNLTELARITAVVHSSDPKALSVYGDILYRQGNLPAATEQYTAALKLSDQLFTTWEQLISIHLSLADYKQAIKIADEALSIYPNQAILYYYMAFAQHRLELNDQAAASIKNALSLDADNRQLQALIFALQGEIFIDQAKYPAADDAYEKAARLDPDNFLLVNNYAYYLAFRNHNLSKAETLIAKAAAALPQNRSIADTYALVLFKQEKYGEAKAWIDKALQNNGVPNPVYLEHLGDILFQMGQKEQAIAEWQRSKAGGNDSEKLNRKINEKKYLK